MIKGLSPQARFHIKRAKAAGVKYEEFEPRAIFERDEYVCHSAPGVICACQRMCDTDVEFPHPDFPTLGHLIAITNGGDHLPSTTFCQRWICNQRQNHKVDTPLKARTERVKRRAVPNYANAKDEAAQRQKPKSKWPKRKMQSRGFQGSRGLSSGVVKWKGRT